MQAEELCSKAQLLETLHSMPVSICASSVEAAHAAQAEKLRSKAQRPEATRSTPQLCRYLLYLGRIRAIQLEYTDAKDCLQQAARKVRRSRFQTSEQYPTSVSQEVKLSPLQRFMCAFVVCANVAVPNLCGWRGLRLLRAPRCRAAHASASHTCFAEYNLGCLSLLVVLAYEFEACSGDCGCAALPTSSSHDCGWRMRSCCLHSVMPCVACRRRRLRWASTWRRPSGWRLCDCSWARR